MITPILRKLQQEYLRGVFLILYCTCCILEIYLVINILLLLVSYYFCWWHCTLVVDKNVDNVTNKFQGVLDRVGDWTKHWRKLNETKSTHINFTYRKKNSVPILISEKNYTVQEYSQILLNDPRHKVEMEETRQEEKRT